MVSFDVDEDRGNKMNADLGPTCGSSGRGPWGVRSHLSL